MRGRLSQQLNDAQSNRYVRRLLVARENSAVPQTPLQNLQLSLDKKRIRTTMGRSVERSRLHLVHRFHGD
jgi:hypothetical protein